jgi:hypothetical protein
MSGGSLGAKAPAVSTTGVTDSGGIEPFALVAVGVVGCPSLEVLFDLMRESRITS